MTRPKTANVEVREIEIDRLFVAAGEARKTIDQAALKELAASIGMYGVQEPLLVRPAEDGRFEIVAGQRRFLASKLEGRPSVPCIVRPMSDEEAAEVRLVSNLQREDLPPQEEAAAFGELLRLPGATVATVAAKVGKSASYVGRRLKLLEAIEPVREALTAGAIEVGHALELGPLSERQQAELLQWLNVGFALPSDEDEDDDVAELTEPEPGTCWVCGLEEEVLGNDPWADASRTVCDDDDCMRIARRRGVLARWSATRTTVAELRHRIARKELRVLRDVPFPLDAELPPMACTACPKRASGPASLFADIAEDTCTDPECLNNKLKVWVKAELDAADREKRALVVLWDGPVQDRTGVSKFDVVVGADCANTAEAIWASGPKMGHLARICCDKWCPEHGVGAKAPAAASGAKGGLAKPAAAKVDSAEQKRRAEAEKEERAKLAEKVKNEREYRARLFRAIAAVPDAEIDAPRIALLTKQACFWLLRNAVQYAAELGPALGWDTSVFAFGSNAGALESLVRGATVAGALRAAALRLVVFELPVGDHDVSRGARPDRMEQVASWLGIDCKAVRAGKDGKPANVAPAAAPKKAATAKKAAKKTAKPAAKKAAKKSKPKPVAKKAAKEAVKR